MIIGSFLYERTATSRLDKAISYATDAQSKVEQVIDGPPVVVTSSPVSRSKQTEQTHRKPARTKPPSGP